MHKQGTAMSINVRPGVFYFAERLQNGRNRLVNIPDSFHERVVWNMFLSKFHVRRKSWICFAEDGMTVAGDDFSFAQGFLHVCSDLLFGRSISLQLLVHFKDPLDHFLV